MRLETAAADEVIRKLRRVEGQIAGIIRMLDEQRDCADVVTQLAATSRALDRAGFRLLACSFRARAYRLDRRQRAGRDGRRAHRPG